MDGEVILSYQFSVVSLNSKTMQDFKNLVVWKRSHALTLDLYRVTKSFPASEQFGLTSQIRRAAASIPANIAEGSGHVGNPELARFLSIASGSASELEYHLILARDLNLIDAKTHNKLNSELVQINRMMGSLITRLKTNKRQ